jgi:hypothetical protein
VISGSAEVPPDAGRGDPGRSGYDAAEAADGYRAWQEALGRDRRKRTETTWYLSIQPSGGARTSLGSAGGRDSPVSPVGQAGQFAGGPPAGHGSVSQQQPSSFDLDRHRMCECVRRLVQPVPALRPGHWAGRRHDPAQHEPAEELHRAAPERPYIPLVDLEALTSSSGTVDGLTTERESLEGFAVAEPRQFNTSTASDVRILIATAGNGMHEGARVAG